MKREKQPAKVSYFLDQGGKILENLQKYSGT